MIMVTYSPRKYRPKRHPAVLYVITCHQRILCLGQMQRDPLDFCRCTVEKKSGTRPGWHHEKRIGGLGIDNVDKAERTDKHDHGNK